jgi:SAM-dependent methyltransferase
MINDNWYREWFNTNYYHLLYRNRDHQEAEQFLINLFNEIRLPKNSLLCDLACGKGRHAQIMQQLGYRVIGLDLSENSIKEAQINSKEGLSFAVHNMLYPFGANRFNGIFNLFTSFGYFNRTEQNLKILKNINAALIPGGSLIIDFFNATWVKNNLVPYEEKKIENIAFKISRYLTQTHVIKEIEVIDSNKTIKYFEKVQLLSFSDFEILLQKSNFAIRKVWGNYQLNNFDLTSSERLIIWAIK